MGTRVNPLAGRYFNDPNIASALSSLASAFAPPGADETLAWAKASNERAEGERLAELYAAAGGDFDKMGVALGQWNPNQSYYAVDTADATTRRGQDVSAETSRLNNTANNERAILEAQIAAVTDLGSTTLQHGEVLPGIPAEVAAALDMPEFAPQSGEALGAAPAPLTESEVMGQLLQGLTPEEQRALALSDVQTQTVIGEEGNPTVVTPYDAIGQTPYNNTGNPAKMTMKSWYDPATDTQGTVMFDPNTGSMAPAVEGGEMPPATAMFFDLGDPVGTNEELGIGKPTQNVIDKGVLSIDQTVTTLDQLTELIRANPASQGLVGDFRSVTQNLVQTGNELGNFFGGEVQAINEAIQGGAADPDVIAAFDPSLPAIEVMANVLAFQYAKTLNNDRLSNEMLLQARRALGLDRMTSNQADSLARLGQVRETLMQNREGLLLKKGGGLNAGAPVATAPTSPEDAALFQKYGLE